MAKDPAFLFYPNDWLGGTMGMTFEEKGAYMELLMMQFNRGHMTSDMIGQVVGQTWDKVKHKFVQDSKKMWYNERLDLEIERRKKYTKSRKNNLSGKNQYSKPDKNTDLKSGHMTSHMENENENVNEDINNNKIVLKKFKFSDLNGLPVQYIQSTREQLKIQKQLDLDEKTISSMWEAFKKQYLNGKESYKNEDEVYKHFINWIKKQNFNYEQQSNTNSKPSGKTSKGSTRAETFEFYRNYASQFSDGSNEKQTD